MQFKKKSPVLGAVSGRLKPALRAGQAAVEYLLVTVALLTIFVTLYKALQWYLSRQFTEGGIVIIRMYTQNP